MDEATLETMRRQSGLTLTRDGELMYGGRPVQHPRVVDLFHRGIEVRADGDVTLTVGRAWCYLAVEGVARFGMRLAADRLTLLDGRELAPAECGVAYGPDDRFYVWHPSLRGPVVLLREAHQALAGVWGGDRMPPFRALVRLDAIPGPADPWPAESKPLEPDLGAELNRA